MEELLELWVKSLSKTKSQRTATTYRMCISSLQRHASGESSLLELEPKTLYSYVDASNLSVSSLLTHLSAIKHFYKFAFRRGWLSKEHYSELEAVIEEIREEISTTKPQRPPKALTLEELRKIFEAVRNTKYERIYSLFLYSGIRLSEYTQLRGEFFYKDKNGIYWLRLPAEVTKRNRERLVPIIGPSREETLNINQNLQHWLEDYERNIRVKAGSLQVFTNRLSQRIKVPFSLHSFRHTYITNLVNAGFPAEVVKEFAGHSNVKTTIDIYYRFNQERARSLVESFLG
ncbi:MAG: tyrosine-type recombinase/integrase [Aquificaceae bacterium]|nr:tyrosine-type recombinase/integrase [Aquificaceae bacterium]MCS7196807.1 tyrosine-type recombinase/integrase [Aquificaceae bacterium]MCX7989315.1 tyrosine-type recombinase/integrase [Aquificaceae bacterium]MDW8294109.1 tyrosine-type recombinase/integrase [Aquificaceae bacterium]